MLDKEAAIETARRYAEAVKSEYAPSAIVLFGSYVNGAPNDDSDIDVGIVFNGFSDDWQKTASRLWNMAYEISWDIEPHLLDAAQDRSGFVKHIFKTGQVIYNA